MVGVNRVGIAPGLTYAGDTAIIDPSGEALSEAKRQETLLFATVKAEEVRDTRNRFPFLKDRREPKA